MPFCFRRGSAACLVVLVAVSWLASSACAAPVQIVGIQVEGNEAVKTQSILDALAPIARPGTTVNDLTALTEKCRLRLERLGYFDTVEVTPNYVQGGVDIAITVREKMRVTKVSFEGNAALTAEQLNGVVRTKVGLFLDRRLLMSDAKRVADSYREAGILATVDDVNWDEEGAVIFKIAEARIADVQVTGLKLTALDDATRILGLKAGDPAVRDRIAEGIENLRRTGMFRSVEANLTPGQGPNDLILQVTVAETPGLFADRIGPPRPDIDPAQLRADVSTIKLDIQYQASIKVNDYLLSLNEDVATSMQKLAQRAAAPDAPAQALYDYARALAAVDRDAEAASQFEAAAAAFTEILPDRPGDVDVMLGLAGCLRGTKRYEAARQMLLQAAQSAPDRWEPAVELALVDNDEVLWNFTRSSADPEARKAALVAVIRTLPWEGTRQALAAAIGPANEDQALSQMATEVVANLEKALRLADSEPAVLRAFVEVISAGLFTVVGNTRSIQGLPEALSAEAIPFFDKYRAVADSDPGFALWSAFFRSINAVLSITSVGAADVTEEQVTEEFRNLAANLTGICEKWPQSLRTWGNMLGLLQFFGGESEMARETFRRATKENPYDRQNYNALLGIAFNTSDWAEMDRVVRERIKYSEAAEDHVLLGKIALSAGKDPAEVLSLIQTAVQRFPDAAVGYVATAGWLVHMGGRDEEAKTLLGKGLQLEPSNAYGHAVRSSLAILSGEPQVATEALKAALKAQPDEELANVLRDRYFLQAAGE